MNIYIYDDFVTEKKYRNTLNKIEIRITDLGLSGKIIRLESIRNVENVITGEIKRGAKTLVALGNNATISKIIRSLTPISEYRNKKFVLGIIPIAEKNNSIATALGISNYEDACDILMARRVKSFDLGTANGEPFISYASIPTENSKLEINSNYSINILRSGTINIINLPSIGNLPENIRPNPGDGKLELYISTKKRGLLNSTPESQSFIPFEELRIINKKHSLLIDESRKIPCPVNIGVEKNVLNIIVGKERNFI